MNQKVKRIILILTVILTLFCLAFIFGNSLKDSAESTDQSMTVKKILTDLASAFGYRGEINVAKLRNFAHVAEFAALGACLSVGALFLARRKKDPSVARVALFLSVSVAVGACIAVLDELLQLSSAGRACELKDVALDCLGIAIGALLVLGAYLILLKIISSRREKLSAKE